MPIDLAPLSTAQIQLRPPITIPGGPAGTRMIFEIESIDFVGQGFQGRMLGQAAADRLTVGPDGTGTLDIRATTELDDGAVMFVQASGRSDFRDADTRPKEIVLALRFETAHPRYEFLDRVQAIAMRTVDATFKVTFEAFMVR